MRLFEPVSEAALGALTWGQDDTSTLLKEGVLGLARMILVIGLHHIFSEKIRRPTGAQAVTVDRRYEGIRPQVRS